MEMREIAVTMAAYNRWMNEQIYEAVAALTDEERRRELGGAFGSVHGTLCHLLVSDRVWLLRFRGEPIPPDVATGVPETFDALREARRRMDDDIDRWASSLDEAFATRPFRFSSIVYRRERTVPGWAAVLHLFNHQTHHRGQVLTMLRQLGRPPGIVADLPWMPLFDADPSATSR
ncbi:MAG TPA: DinB family protein [Vicinamibacterales bacterium]